MPLLYKNEIVHDGSVLAGLILLELATPSGKTWTHTEIAEACGCTPHNIRQIENKALKKLEAAFRRRLTIKDIMNIEAINELEQPIWSVITHDRVIVHRVTHAAARIALEGVSDRFPNSAVILTADAAERATRTAGCQPANLPSGNPFDKQRGAI